MEVRPEMIILIVLLVVALTYFIMQNNQQQPSCPVCPAPKTVYVRRPEQDNKSNDTENNENNEMENNRKHIVRNPTGPISRPNPTVNVDINDTTHVEGGFVDPLRDFDYRVYHDKLTPPRHRNIHEPEYMNPALIPIYTQGPPKPYRKVGVLSAVEPAEGEPVSTPTYKFLNLIGSKISSGQFNYYAVPPQTDVNLKFEIDTKNELYDGDQVTISILNQKYDVKLDKNALPLYAGIL